MSGAQFGTGHHRAALEQLDNLPDQSHLALGQFLCVNHCLVLFFSCVVSTAYIFIVSPRGRMSTIIPNEINLVHWYYRRNVPWLVTAHASIGYTGKTKETLDPKGVGAVLGG